MTVLSEQLMLPIMGCNLWKRFLKLVLGRFLAWFWVIWGEFLGLIWKILFYEFPNWIIDFGSLCVVQSLLLWHPLPWDFLGHFLGCFLGSFFGIFFWQFLERFFGRFFGWYFWIWITVYSANSPLLASASSRFWLKHDSGESRQRKGRRKITHLGFYRPGLKTCNQ